MKYWPDIYFISEELMSFKQLLTLTMFIALSIPINAHAQTLEFQINYEIKEHHRDKISQSAKTKIKTKKGQTTITLEPRIISVRSGNYEKIYDFGQNTVASVDHDKQQYTRTSLYAIPAFKDYEKRNRKILSKVMQKAGINALETNQFELEMIFGGDINGSVAKNIESKDAGKIHKLYYKDENIASYELSEQRIPSNLTDIYKKYLTYEYRIHPVIVEKLTDKGFIFHSLKYRNKQEIPYLTENVYMLTASDSKTEGIISIPKNYQENYASDKRLDKIIKLSTIKENSVDYYASQMNTLWDKKKYLEASLLFHEYSIHHGLKDFNKIKPAVQRLFKEAPPESGIKNLTAAITQQPSSKKKIRQAIEIIERAQKQSSSHGYVLNIYLANYYGAIGQNKKAIDLILMALEQNPFLTGAYKDLGDKYFKSYQMPNAWASWDHMQRINPDHQLVPVIQNFEKKIKKRHPEHFQ